MFNIKATKEIQAKIIRRQYTTIKMTKKKIVTTITAGKEVKKREYHTLLVGMQNYTFTLKNSLAISLKNHTVTHNPVFVILGIYRTEMKTYVDTKTC